MESECAGRGQRVVARRLRLATCSHTAGANPISWRTQQGGSGHPQHGDLSLDGTDCYSCLRLKRAGPLSLPFRDSGHIAILACLAVRRLI